MKKRFAALDATVIILSAACIALCVALALVKPTYLVFVAGVLLVVGIVVGAEHPLVPAQAGASAARRFGCIQRGAGKFCRHERPGRYPHRRQRGVVQRCVP